MTALQILLVVDVTVGVVLGIAYLLTWCESRWTSRRNVHGTNHTTVDARPVRVVDDDRGQLGLVVVQPSDLPPAPAVDAPAPDPDDDCDSADDDDTDPDRSELRAAWYDSRSCWGCAKRCKASSFKPYGFNIGADVRGACAARARVATEQPYHAGFAPSERHAQSGVDGATSVASLWSDLCQRCGEWMRSGGSVQPAVVVAADDSSPF